MNNKEKVFRYMERNGEIDQWRAFSDLKVMRLAAVVFDLKASGIPIEREMKYKLDKDGKVVSRWAVYRLGYTERRAG